MVQADIIYSNKKIHEILENKTKEGTYYIIYDDIFFEKIRKKENISRKFYTDIREIINSKNVIKYISFSLKKEITTEEIYSLVSLLRKNTIILLTLFNPIENECDLLFISNEYDLEVEHYINNFIEIEEI